MDENKFAKNVKGTNVRTYKFNDINVTIHTPEKVQNRVRQEKINRIYDLLSPKPTVLK